MNLAEHNSQSDNQTDYWWNHVTDINIYYPKGPITQFKCWANYYTQWKNRYIEVWRGLVGTCTNKPLTLLDFICIGRWYLFLTRLNTSHFVYFSSIIADNQYFLNSVQQSNLCSWVEKVNMLYFVYLIVFVCKCIACIYFNSNQFITSLFMPTNNRSELD